MVLFTDDGPLTGNHLRHPTDQPRRNDVTGVWTKQKTGEQVGGHLGHLSPFCQDSSEQRRAKRNSNDYHCCFGIRFVQFLFSRPERLANTVSFCGILDMEE
jgi:hypothetical protein